MNQVLRASFDVEAEFGIHLVIGARTQECCAQPGTKAACESHTSSGVVRRMPEITETMRFHSAASL